MVKEYLLPLFEADDKKFIHSKGRMQLAALSRMEVSTMSAVKQSPPTVYEELKLSETLSNELSMILPAETVARINNKLSNTEAALEAAKMENSSLMSQIVEVSKREDRLRNQIQSQLATQDLAVKKLERAEKNSQAFEQQIAMLKTQLEKFENTYKSVCQDLQTERNKNQALGAEINDLKHRLTLANVESESYTKTAGEMRSAHRTFMDCYGNQSRFQLDLDSFHRILKENSHSLNSFQSELTEVPWRK